jgi:hypothetical protein
MTSSPFIQTVVRFLGGSGAQIRPEFINLLKRIILEGPNAPSSLSDSAQLASKLGGLLLERTTSQSSPYDGYLSLSILQHPPSSGGSRFLLVVTLYIALILLLLVKVGAIF